ncbi:hypothetical protein KAR91_13950 [Candidatus Pacearchaeota archaeon]|nr:hypothetical protein [Candidatus Pacearchaeota archaeon]
MEDLAYSVARAYENTRRSGDAVKEVKEMYPNLDTDTILVMWAAIDAYVDIFTTPKNTDDA